jgi:DUF4097 and DUF4098 domain-containing protein YvlB
MKRLIIVVLLVGIAAIAGIVRSHTKAGGSLSDLKVVKSHESTGDLQEEIRNSYELAAGARVEIAGINGAVKIETSDSQTAEVYIARKAKSREALDRRRVVVENTSTSLTIRGQKGNTGLFGWLFKTNASEQVILRLPRQVSLVVGGVNGSVTVGEIDGPVEIHGVNGKVEVAQIKGAAQFRGINGNVIVALTQVDPDQVSLAGINGNIELRLNQGVNASLEAHGMNGKVHSDLPDFFLEEARHGRYRAQIGNGGNTIEANGINGNIRLSRSLSASVPAEQPKSKG